MENHWVAVKAGNAHRTSRVGTNGLRRRACDRRSILGREKERAHGQAFRTQTCRAKRQFSDLSPVYHREPKLSSPPPTRPLGL